MLRRTIVIVWIFTLAILLAPLIIFQITSLTFFDEQAVLSKVLPKSYPSVTMVFAEQFSRDDSDVDVLTERIRNIIPEQTYTSLLTPMVKDVFSELRNTRSSGDIVLDLADVKKVLTSQLPAMAERMSTCSAKDAEYSEFRLCYPTAIASADPKLELHSILGDAIQKEIPPRLTFNENIRTVANIVTQATYYIPYIIGAIFLIGGSIIVLLVGIKFSQVVMGIGGLLMFLGLFLGIIVYSFIRLPEVAPIFNDLSTGEVQLVKYIATVILQTVSVVATMLVIAGTSGVISAYFISRRNNNVL